MAGRIAVVVLGIVAVALVTPAPAATSPSAKCGSAKLKAACKKAACKAGLEAKEASTGKPITQAQIDKCEANFAKVFSKVEAKGGCGTTGDANAIEAKVDAYVADLATELDVATGTNPNKCEGAKIKAAAKKTSCKCALEAKHVLKGTPIDPIKAAQCEAKFSQAYVKVETKGGCNTSDDDAAIEAKVDAFIADARTELDPTATTTTTTVATTTTDTFTTTTTMTTTTSTSSTTTTTDTVTTTVTTSTAVTTTITTMTTATTMIPTTITTATTSTTMIPTTTTTTSTTVTTIATTTTTTSSTTTTTCPSSAGSVLKGALTATLGRFNYNLTLGLPGANSACNTNFPGTHACSYAELQSAQTAGDLDGLKDTACTTVTSFWAIDAAQPALQQCSDDAVGGSNQRWEYGTAHTASRGQRVTLNNVTGALGVLQSSVQCNIAGSSWVGCCQ